MQYEFVLWGQEARLVAQSDWRNILIRNGRRSSRYGFLLTLHHSSVTDGAALRRNILRCLQLVPQSVTFFIFLAHAYLLRHAYSFFFRCLGRTKVSI